MARNANKPLGRLLETIKVKNYGDVDIRIHVPSGSFHAELLGEHLNNSSKKELEAAIIKLVGQRAKLEWIPVIEIDKLQAVDHPKYKADPERGSVVLEIERYWIARTKGGRREYEWLRSDWSNDQWRDPDDKAGIATPQDMRLTLASESREDYRQLDKYKVREYFYNGSFDEHIYLTYTDPMWEALLDLIQRMHTLNGLIRDLIITPDGRAALRAGNGPLQIAGRHG